MQLRQALAVAVCVSAIFATSSAWAAGGPKERAEAKTLWTKGKRLVAQEKWDEAVEAFRAASELHPMAQYELDLARALAEAGALVEAKEVAERVAQTTEPNTQRAKAAALKLSQALVPRIPSLQIVVEGDPSGTASVTVNGDDVETGSALPFDPGSYLVKAEAPGAGEAKERVELAEGQHRTVRLVLAPVAAPVAAPTEDDEDGGGTLLPAAIAFGVGGAGVIVGSVFGVLGFSETAAVEEACGGRVCPPERAADVDRAQQYGTVSTAAFVIGGVGIAAGVVLALTVGSDDDDETPERDAWVRPYVGPGAVGVIGAF